MPALELQQVLKQELLQNPLLEEVEELTEEATLDEAQPQEQQANSEPQEPDDIVAAAQEKQEEEKASDDGIDWDEFFHDSYEHGRNFNERPRTISTRRCRRRRSRSTRAFSRSSAWSRRTRS